MFGSEYIHRREPGLTRDAIPKVNCETDVAGPQGIPSAANGCMNGAILHNGRHRELACAVEPNGLVRAAVELEERVAIPTRAVAKIEPLVSGPAAQVNRPPSKRSASNSGAAKGAPANVVIIPGAPRQC
jgi:hypothetical protein